MRILTFFYSSYGWVGLVLSLMPFFASAGEATIAAEYRPSNNSPSMVQFTNTTPCQLPGATQTWCDKVDGNTPVIVTLSSPTRKRFVASGDVRDAIYLRTPPVQKVTLTNDEGDSKELLLRIEDFGYKTSKTDGELPLHNLSAASMSNPSSGSACSSGGRSVTGTSSDTYFFWQLNPENRDSGGVCFGNLKEGTDDQFVIRELYIGYSLETEAPALFRNGIYRGTMNLTVGSEGDISLGNIDGSQLITLNFEITVKHAFRLEFPPDSERVVLAPVGGWGPWINSAKAPPALQRDIPFSLTTSGPLTMKLECEHISGTGCGLKNRESDEVVALKTMVTLPGLFMMGTNDRVEDVPLGFLPNTRYKFNPQGFSYERRSWLRFLVEQADVQRMIAQPGSRWSGNVTVIFDADHF